MTTDPIDHYAEAERIMGEIDKLREAAKEIIDTRQIAATIPVWIAEAQVHATLALAQAHQGSDQ